MVLTLKKKTNLETQLLKFRHMSRPIFFYLGLPNSILKPMFVNVCGLPIISQASQVSQSVYFKKHRRNLSFFSFIHSSEDGRLGKS